MEGEDNSQTQDLNLGEAGSPRSQTSFLLSVCIILHNEMPTVALGYRVELS